VSSTLHTNPDRHSLLSAPKPDRATQAEGIAEKTAGKVQANVGKASDAVKDKLKK
jgi:hypothetical protein